VPRPTNRQARAQRRLQDLALKIAVLGAVLIILPLALKQSAVATALQPWVPVGWLMLVAGVCGAWWLRGKSHCDAAPNDPPASRSPRRPSRPPLPVARVEPVTPPPGAASPAVVPPRLDQWGPGVFAAIEWRRFEAVVEALFAQAGFITKALSHGADEGVDIWLYSTNQPDGAPVSIVQCKHWQGRAVGVDKIRELRGVMAARNVQRGQFATTSTFTPDAIAFGRLNGINLLDVEGLLSLIASRTPAQQQALLDVAYEGDYWRPTCANCGVKLVERTRADGGVFWGCINYPSGCRTTMQKAKAR
jgi:restriction system protein